MWHDARMLQTVPAIVEVCFDLVRLAALFLRSAKRYPRREFGPEQTARGLYRARHQAAAAGSRGSRESCGALEIV